jgi:transposase
VQPLEPERSVHHEDTTVGIDLAKSVFQVHAVDERGRAVLRKQRRRDQMTAFFANLPPCLIGMEACASAHHWARTLQRFGHTVRLMAPQFVKPYVKTNKNDVADAEAICEAVGRPNMRFVPIKSVEQQAVLALHRVRQGFVRARTAQGNQIRGLLGEFGLIIPKGIVNVAKRVPTLLEDAGDEVPASFRQLIERLTKHLKELDRQVDELEAQIKAWHRGSELSRKLEKIPGIGPLGASALVASIADANSFENGRQLSAWLGLVPRQDSSGGKPKLLGISKRGDPCNGEQPLCKCLRSFGLRGRRTTPGFEDVFEGLPRRAPRGHPTTAARACRVQRCCANRGRADEHQRRRQRRGRATCLATPRAREMVFERPVRNPSGSAARTRPG